MTATDGHLRRIILHCKRYEMASFFMPDCTQVRRSSVGDKVLPRGMEREMGSAKVLETGNIDASHGC